MAERILSYRKTKKDGLSVNWKQETQRNASISETMKVSNKSMRYDEKLDRITKFITVSETKCCLSVGGSRQTDAHSCHASPEALIHLATEELTSVNRVRLGHISWRDQSKRVSELRNCSEPRPESRTVHLYLTLVQEEQIPGRCTFLYTGWQSYFKKHWQNCSSAFRIHMMQCCRCM